MRKTRMLRPRFGEKHKAYNAAAYRATITVAEGAVRSGKTVDNVAVFAKHIEDGTADRIHLATASTLPAAKMIIGDCNGFGLEWIFRGRCRWSKYKGNEALIITVRKRQYVVIFAGGAKADSFKKIRGMSFGMWIATEINLHHESMIQEAFNRQLAAKNRRIFWDLNPFAPGHWIYTKYIDRFAERFGDAYNYGHFLIRDNVTITQERLAEIVNQYIPGSVWYKRDIEGVRCNAEGLIYEDYTKGIVTAHSPPGGRWREVALSIDYGTQNAFAALLWGRDGDTWNAFAEYRYSGRDERRQKTDEDYVRDMEAFVTKHLPDNQRTGLLTIIDPSAASFIAAIGRSHLRFRVRKADNDVLDGIRDTAVCLQRGTVRIFDTLLETRKELEGYVWDEKGEDKPVKENDHLCDSLRYFVRTMRLVKPTNRDYVSPFVTHAALSGRR